MCKSTAATTCELTVIAPAHNEQDNVAQLVTQVKHAIGRTGRTFEFIIIDDGSTDDTLPRLRDLQREHDFLRVIRMADTPPGRGHGQSAAFAAGFAAAHGQLIALLDADLQNDPADFVPMLEQLEKHNADMVQGDRSANRRDHLGRRAGSWVGRTFRRLLLGDTIRDTGCSLRIMKREVARAIPLEFAGMHRFIPITAQRLGYTVIEFPVTHRPRAAGTPKYGTFNRAIPALLDCLAVRWMFKRRRPTRADEIHRGQGETPLPPARAG